MPAERERLRKVGGFKQEDLAKALTTRRETIVRWEVGATEPRRPKCEAYVAFPARLALRHGTVEPSAWLRWAQAVAAPALAPDPAWPWVGHRVAVGPRPSP